MRERAAGRTGEDHQNGQGTKGRKAEIMLHRQAHGLWVVLARKLIARRLVPVSRGISLHTRHTRELRAVFCVDQFRERGVQLRILLLLMAIAFFVDAFFFSGGFTQAAYAQVSVAAEQFVALIGDAVEIGPEKQGST